MITEKEFLQMVYDMRQAQRKFFSHKTDSNLKMAKIKEQRVDDVLKQAIQKGMITVSSAIVNQSILFKK